ncbi:hypothetical protein ABPG72_003760 [Tetrahymena utriculariae]
MDLVFVNKCSKKDHHNQERDQICLSEECEGQKMCLYCRIDHSQNHKNHEVIPINKQVKVMNQAKEKASCQKYLRLVKYSKRCLINYIYLFQIVFMKIQIINNIKRIYFNVQINC